jgi:hypothetical protein
MQVFLPDTNVNAIAAVALNYTLKAITSTAHEFIAIGLALIYGFESLLDVRRNVATEHLL